MSAALPDFWQSRQERTGGELKSIEGEGSGSRDQLLSSTPTPDPYRPNIETYTRRQKYPGDLQCKVITANNISRDAAAHPSPELGLRDQGNLFPTPLLRKIQGWLTTNTMESRWEQDLPLAPAWAGALSRCWRDQKRFNATPSAL